MGVNAVPCRGCKLRCWCCPLDGGNGTASWESVRIHANREAHMGGSIWKWGVSAVWEGNWIPESRRLELWGTVPGQPVGDWSEFPYANDKGCEEMRLLLGALYDMFYFQDR